MNAILPTLMTVDEFLRWSQARDGGRYELERGRIVVMQAENVGGISSDIKQHHIPCHFTGQQ